MARKIVWSFEATADLGTIADYIAKDSAFYAASFVQEIREASRSLNVFSERGRIVPELSNQNIRELFIKEYRLVYSIEETRVVIVGLIHGRRDLKALWEEEQREN
ncbi:MAG: type II toxin-antitoxin system RelE/ParE family toxin [Nitrospirota bacterium]|nr:type II toxin-antitoxin system RelE/ParE family toxin [Nitrospirota bacterium]